MLRSYEINIKKNWTLQPSQWNSFFTNLESDLNDIYDEMQAFTKDYSFIFKTSEDISKYIKNNPYGQSNLL